MGKKIIEVDGKKYVVDEKEMEEVQDVTKSEDGGEGSDEGAEGADGADGADENADGDESADEEADEDADDGADGGEKKYDNKAVEKATDSVLEKLGINEMKSDIASIKDAFEKKTDKKAAGLINLEKLMKKNVGEMTSREKIVGFFAALITNDEPVLKVLSEGVAAYGGYLFPDEFRYEIIRDIEEKPHMRKILRLSKLLSLNWVNSGKLLLNRTILSQAFV